MIETLGHRTIVSLKEFIDYRLLKDLRAFSTKTGVLYSYTDKKLINNKVYGSSYAQWVYHSEVSGTIVPSGFNGYNRGSGGMAIDYINGRVIFNSGYSNLVLTGSFSVPNINTYITTSPHSALLNQTNFAVLPNLKAANTNLDPYSSVLPGIFLRLSRTDNEEACFGGGSWTDYDISITALMTNAKYMVGVSEVIRDLKNRNIPILDEAPLNEFNDLKDPSWNYGNFISNPTDYAIIQDCSLGFIENDDFTERNPSLSVGFGNIKLRTFRFSQQEFP